MSGKNLQEQLKALRVHWEGHPPILTVVDPKTGKLELTICTSFSHDPGYSIFKQGLGYSLEECVENLETLDV
jgi:hypothetical protein